MSNANYIIEMLELNDNNIKFYEFVSKIKVIFQKTLNILYCQPIIGLRCGVILIIILNKLVM